MLPQFSSLPIWFNILFVSAFPIWIALIGRTIRHAAQDTGFDFVRTQRIMLFTFGFYLLYLLYVSLMSFTGIFLVNTLPPRILLLTAVPYLMVLLVLSVGNSTFKLLLHNARIEDLILIHSFRFVGIVFLIAAWFGALPTKFAVMAGVGDILSAIGAMIVAKMVKNRSERSIIALWVWNIFGTLDILSVLVNAVVETRISIETGSQGVLAIAQFPYSWIPAIAPVTILFAHGRIFAMIGAFRRSVLKSA